MNRAERHPMVEWWATIDRTLFSLAVGLIACGIVLSFAASPAVAERLRLDPFHFATRQALFAPLAIFVMIAVSFLDERGARRTALFVVLASLAAMLMVLITGSDVNGAKRWIDLGFISLQPSEFMKPALAIVAAWLFAEGGRRSDAPGLALSFGLIALVLVLLILQPDFGQAILTFSIWSGLWFAAGMPWLFVAAVGGFAIVGGAAAYHLLPHVTARIDKFLDPSLGDTFQVGRALASFGAGGWLGAGAGEGDVKRVLPDSHTDFVFAVIGEEYGAAGCLLLVGAFAALTLRGLAHALRTENAFRRLAICGLALLFGLQSAINFAVTLALLPAKGMTLPFLSYGGSSLLASAFAMGLLLALTRRRAEPRFLFGARDGERAFSQ